MTLHQARALPSGLLGVLNLALASLALYEEGAALKLPRLGLLKVMYRVTHPIVHRYFSVKMGYFATIWWAATAASYCPSRPGELSKQNMTKSHE